MKQYYIYIMTNKSKTLYTGVTNNLERRVIEHKRKLFPGFTAKYNIDSLAYFEVCQDIRVAIAREKQIKGWLRARKIELIESGNPQWRDLSSNLVWSRSTAGCHSEERSDEESAWKVSKSISLVEFMLRLKSRSFALLRMTAALSG